jgi:dCMP deaminase
MAVARSVAQRSLCDRDRVGAVIVTPANRVVSVGYNGPPAGLQTHGGRCTGWCPRAGANRLDRLNSSLDPEYEDCFALHAEANALSVCDRVQREGGTIYVTSGVCFGCAKLIANSGLVRVVVPVQDGPAFAHRNSDRSYDFLKTSGVRVYVHTLG